MLVENRLADRLPSLGWSVVAAALALAAIMTALAFF
jgi:hypothetical protein